MRMVGLLGGMSWESSREYYRIINEQVREARGGLSSATLLLHSFDFAEIAALQSAGEWTKLEQMLSRAARGLELAGAEAMLICTNYMHRCAHAVEASLGIPLLHIADAMGEEILEQGQQRVGLLGAQGTMEHPFYAERLQAMGIDVIIPDLAEREVVNRVIFEELCQGRFTDHARAEYIAIISGLLRQGAQGIILGCTEIEQLIRKEDLDAPVYPSAEIHARKAAKFILDI